MTHEWAGLVGQNRFNLQYHHWTVLFPLFGYLFVLLTLHLIARGLDAREQERHT